jgi:hypothetical protein
MGHMSGTHKAGHLSYLRYLKKPQTPDVDRSTVSA